MDAFYTFLTSNFGVSPLNTTLLLIIFFLAKQRYEDQAEKLIHVMKRNERVERSLLQAGIQLLDME